MKRECAVLTWKTHWPPAVGPEQSRKNHEIVLLVVICGGYSIVKVNGYSYTMNMEIRSDDPLQDDVSHLLVSARLARKGAKLGWSSP